MHTTKDYSKSPAKAFDAVEDVKSWLGEQRWAAVGPHMAAITDPFQFSMWADLSGIKGYPVEAWYELYHGQGSWDKAWAEKEREQSLLDAAATGQEHLL